PAALSGKMLDLGALLRDQTAEMPAKSVQVQIVPEFQLAVVVFALTGWAGGGNHFTNHLAVFRTESGEDGTLNYRLIDTLVIGGRGTRSVDKLRVAVQQEQDGNSLLLRIPAKANLPEDSPNFPSKPITLTLRLKDQRLSILSPKTS
ncbi:hypothetical protein, partial [Undibacterium luofuense]